MRNAFSVDLEDYFHPTEVSADASIWSRLEPRVDVGTSILLDLLAEYNTRATFFVLGWVAETNPALLGRIVAAGHEIGCHSYQHRLIYNLSATQFREDTSRAVRAIEDACGRKPKLYRAPSYSIVPKCFWALDILAELGFTHDSSIYPIVHDRYGVPGSPRHAYEIRTPSGPILEVPVATVQLTSKLVSPVGGGAYLRLFPYRYIGAGIRRINRVEGKPACIYVHPWEVDVNQPRMTKNVISRVRTYAGLRTVRAKLNRMFLEFEFGSLSEVYPFPGEQYTDLAMMEENVSPN